jgi:lipoprotein-anchoring transpeptidase ErfK/SrfK
LLALAVVAPLGLTACTGGEAKGPRPEFVEKGSASASAEPPAPAAPVAAGTSLTVTPPTGAKDLPVSTEIAAKVDDGKLGDVKLSEVGGGAVRGRLRDDASAWVPDKPLKYGKQYEATVTATSGSGQPATATTTFTTMKKPSSVTGSGLYLFDGNTYGVAMPVVVEFVPGVAKKDRAGVQKRMFVTTDPPQPGTWHWVGDGSQAYYRAPAFWKPDTKINVRIAIEGHPMGKGRFGNLDRRASVTIGRKLEVKVDNASKQLSVHEGGRVTKTMPVSLGKPKTPSSSGTMVVMEKKEKTVFDTFAELGPREGYRTDIDFAQRLTWGGEFMHAASWSVGQQGRSNVSHGCVNLSPANARWLFGKTMVGDPVTVKGTERRLAAGNGWTAWDMSWEEFAKGSALPVPDTLRATEQ